VPILHRGTEERQEVTEEKAEEVDNETSETNEI